VTFYPRHYLKKILIQYTHSRVFLKCTPIKVTSYTVHALQTLETQYPHKRIPTKGNN